MTAYMEASCSQHVLDNSLHVPDMFCIAMFDNKMFISDLTEYYFSASFLFSKNVKSIHAADSVDPCTAFFKMKIEGGAYFKVGVVNV